ncbi:MAG TPA: phosphoglycolate phosphatase [Rikenellaceae bacterium]|nr:phosphoglycolate phosphatase [Rikenellaceae bacterium]
MTKLAIFDLDGTLLNTVEDLGNATNYALEQCGFPAYPIDSYYQMVGRGIFNMFRAALPSEYATEDNVQKMASYFLPYYDAHKCDFTRPYDGILEMLRKITERGVRLAVASNKYQDGAEKLVKHFFGEYDFVKILGQREGQPIKPDPAIVSQVLAEVPSVTKDETVYVGDSNVDMQTGVNAQVRTIGVTWGFRSREELASYNPSAIVDNAEALADEILK